MYRREIWAQWDKQEKTRRQRIAYCQLNNLYLAVERGQHRLTIAVANQLETLLSQAYDHDDQMVGWWQEQFHRLPGWFEA